MEAFWDTVQRVARTHMTVTLVGESGTGKELTARAIHDESPRRYGPFHAISCATLSPTLLESQLFGHLRGSFTGAERDQPGLFALADGGTLFLDEVAETPPEVQPKLLRVLQEKNFLPLGARQVVSSDVRIIAASNRDLRTEVAENRFRADLSYRLRVVPLTIPPLRDRHGDLEALFWHFVDELNRSGLRRVEGATQEAMKRIRSHTWPGNVRELRSAVEYAFATGQGPILGVLDLPENDAIPPAAPAPTPKGSTLSDLERERVISALTKHKGRKGPAAVELGVSRSTLWRKLHQLGLS